MFFKCYTSQYYVMLASSFSQKNQCRNIEILTMAIGSSSSIVFWKKHTSHHLFYKNKADKKKVWDLKIW